MKKKLIIALLLFASIFTLASCKANKKTLSFVTNQSDIALDSVVVNKGSEIDLTRSEYLLSKEGFTFKGWYFDVNFTQIARSIILDNDTTVYAKWSEIFTISFNSNGGNAISSLTVEENETIQAPTDPVKSGFVFEGWYTEAELKNAYKFTSTVTSSFTLYAKWAESLQVKFEVNGGETVSPINVIEGNKITLPSTTKTGYILQGWFKEEALTHEFLENEIVSDNLTLYAKWKAIQYTLIFNANGADGTTSNQQFTYDVKGNLSLVGFTKTGYTFVSWNTKADGSGTSYSDQAEINNLSIVDKSEITLYAIWRANSYSIVLDKNNVNATGEAASIKASYDKTYHVKNSYLLNGYVFTMWNTKADGSGTSYKDDAEVKNLILEDEGSLTLFAIWKAINYHVVFNKNNDVATGTMGNQDFAFDSELELHSNAFSVTGYHFSAWNTKADGSGTSYSDEALVKNLTSIEGESINLYAIWKVNSYSISLDPSGATGTPKTLKVNYDETISLTLISTLGYLKTGYHFVSWISGDKTYSDGESVKNLTTENGAIITLKANFAPNTYTVSFDKNKGDGSMTSMNLTYGTPSTLLNNSFTKVGYTFDGWNTKADGKGIDYANLASINIVTENGATIVLYAKWQKNTYTINFDAAGGNGNVNAMTGIKYDEAVILTSSVFTKVGYLQTSWNTKEDGSGTSYSLNQSVMNLVSTPAGSITLYATYTANTYTIKYDAAGGSGMVSSLTGVKYDETVTLSTTLFTKVGYLQTSWNTQSDQGGTSYDIGLEIKNLTTINNGTVTLYAVYTPITYTVEYSSNSGSGTMEDSIFTYDKANTIKENAFTKEGYLFTYWTYTYLNNEGTLVSENYSSGSSMVNFTSVKDATITLKANWDPNGYTITFNSNGGSNVASINEDYDTSLSSYTLPNPTKTGYTFLGWFDNLELSGSAITSLPEKMGLDKTYYAKWEAVSYSITYNVNGGNPVSNANYTIESEDITLIIPTRDYYTFKGWYQTSDFSGSINTKIVSGSTGNKVYYAKWEAIVYSITYYVNGGTDVSNSSYTYESSAITLPLTTRVGYTFLGWFTSADLSGASVTSIPIKSSGNLIFYAKWSLDSYTITYHNVDKVTNLTDGVISYSYTTPTINLFTPKANGYTFLGWFSDASFTTSLSQIVTNSVGNVDLYAKFEVIPYTIVYTTYSSSSIVNTNPTTFNVESTKITLVNLSKIGYIFLGWYKENTFENKIEEIASGTYLSIGSSALNLYAKWTPITYTVKFDKNEGVGSLMDESFKYDEEKNLSTNTITRTGYNFLGWNSEANGSGTSYSDNETVKNLSSTNNGEVTLYAQWSIITYSIQYDLDGGNVLSDNPASFNITTVSFTLVNPTKVGYTFSGWSGTGLTEAETSLTIEAGSIGNRSYKANWQVNQYTLTFKNADGTVFETSLVNYQSTIILPLTNPVKVGYSFNKWENALAIMPAYDYEVNPTWTAKTDTIYTIEHYFEGLDGNYVLDSTKTTTPKGTTDTNATGSPLASLEGFTYNSSNSLNVTSGNIAGDGSLVLKFYYTRNTYTITFASTGDTTIDPITLKYGESITSPSNPTKIGYTFSKWDVTIPSVMPSGNMTITALWTINQYTITFNSNGGSAVLSITQDYASTIIAPANPTKTGYTFAGWDVTIPSVMPAENMTITASWTINQYALTVSYQEHGSLDSASATSGNYDFNSSITVVAKCDLGYNFSGWYNGDNQLSGSLSYTFMMPAEAYLITAKFGASVSTAYQVEHYQQNILNDEYTLATTENLTGTTGNNTAAQSKTYEGFNALSFSQQTILGDGSTVVKIYYTRNTYTITFASTGDTTIDPITLKYGASITSPSNPTKTSYTFSKWDITIPSVMPAENMTITAIWNPISYTITYSLNGGTNSALNPDTYTIESATITLSDPSRSGYTFAGWFSDSALTVSSSSILAGSTLAKEFYAKWTPVTYSITYHLNDGEDNPSNPLSYTIEDSLITLEDVSKAGYTFAGWFSDSALTISSSKVAALSTGNKDFYAKWNIVDYNITYSLNGGTNGSNAVNYQVSDPTFELKDATKNGYTFIGWYDNALFTGEKVTHILLGSVGDITLYASFEVKTYNITYTLQAGGVNNSLNPSTYTINDSTITLMSPLREGYTFTNWTKNGAVISSISSGSYGDITLVANYTLDNHTVTFMMNGGTTIAPLSFTFESDSITLPLGSRLGYTFVGWFDNASFTGDMISEIPSGGYNDLVLYAKWEIITYHITYGNGAYSASNPETYNIESGTITLVNPSRSGYTFEKWYSDSSLTTSIDGSIVQNSTGDKVFYAGWNATLTSYQITYYTNGGNNLSNTSFTVETNNGSDIIALKSDPTRVGYVFSGWYFDEELSLPVSTIPTGTTTNLRLYAKWIPITFSVTYDVNGGDGTNATTNNIEYAGSAVFEDKGFTKSGFIFLGWALSSSASTPDYFVGNSLSRLASIQDASVTVYAVYVASTYSIIYELDEGVNGSNPSTYTSSDGEVALNQATKTGYTFAGWYSDQSFTTSVTSINGITANLTLYAKFTPNTYKIVFNINGGTKGSMADETYSYNEAKALFKNNFIYAGHHFLKWSTTELGNEAGVIFYSDTEVIKNLSSTSEAVINLYAIWEVNQYTVKYDGSGSTSGFMADSIFTYGESNTLTMNSYQKLGYSFQYWTYYSVVKYTNGQTLTGVDHNRTITIGSTTYDVSSDTYGNILVSDTTTISGSTTYFCTFENDGVYTLGYKVYSVDGTGKITYYQYDIDSSYDSSTYVYSGTRKYLPYAYGGTALNAVTVDANTVAYATNSSKVAYAVKNSVTYYYDLFNQGDPTFIPSTTSSRIGTVEVVHENITTEEGTVYLRAVWKANSFSVAFNANGGEGSMTNEAFEYNVSKALTTNTFTKEGYRFIGWNTDSFATTAKYTDSEEVSNLSSIDGETINLYAIFEPITSTVSFNANTGSGTMDSQSFTYGKADSLKTSLFTKVGYTFIGWSTTSDGAVSYADGASITSLTGDISLFAKWRANSYLVKFNSNEGVGTMADLSFTYDDAKALTLNTFTKVGYTFTGWALSVDKEVLYNDQQEVQNLLEEENGVITLYAKWTPNNLTVTFNANGGTGTMDNQSFKYMVDFVLSSNLFIKTGYTFAGWMDANDNYYDDGQLLNLKESLTLSAKWEAKVFTITYDKNGGDGTMNNSAFVSSGSLKGNLFTRKGYIFVGWGVSAEGEALYRDKASITLYSNITLYAVWEKAVYTISYLANGGVGSMDNESIIYGSSHSLTNSAFTKIGYTFTGWSLMSDGTPSYLDGGSLSITDDILNNYIFNGTINLYAIYTANKYNVIFDAAGGSSTMANLELTYDVAKALTINAFTKDNFIFAGWNTKADGSGIFYSDQEIVKNLSAKNDITLYAMWESILRTVSVYGTDGYNQSSSALLQAQVQSGAHLSDWVDLEDQLRALLSTTYSGYTYVALYQTKGLKNKLNGNETCSEDTIIYAYYTKTLTFDLSSIGMDNLVIDLFRSEGVKTSYSAYKYVPFGGSINYYDVLGKKYTGLPQVIDIDGRISFFDIADVSAITQNTTITYYSIDCNDPKVTLNGTYKKQVTIGSNVYTIYDLYTGKNTMSGITTITALTSYAPFTVNGNVITVGDNQNGHALAKMDGSYVYISIHTTLTDFSISSGYQDYTNLNLNSTRYIDKTKVAYEVGSADVFRLRFSIKNYVGGAMKSALVSKHYLVNISGVGNLSATYRTDISLDSTTKKYVGFEYKYGDVVYLYIVPSEDSTDLNYDMVKFTANATSKVATFKITPTYSKLGTEMIQMTFNVNDGVNVETNEELKIAYANLDVHQINIHSRIIAALSANQYRDYYDKTQSHYPLNLQTNQELIYEQNDSIDVHSGSVYVRAVKNSQTLTDLVINGNYFTIDGSGIPVIEVNEDGSGWSSSYQGYSINEFGNINSGYLSGSEYQGKYVKNVQTSIFLQDLSYYDVNNSIAGDHYSDYKFTVGQAVNAVTYNNMYIISNTITPMVNFGAETATQSQQVDLACYNSGGYNGIMARCCTMNTDNVIVDYATIGIYGSCEGTTVNNADTYVYYSWANSLYCWGNVQVNITNSEYRYAGGSCLWIEDHDAQTTNTTLTSVIDQTSVTIYHNPSLTMDKKTRVSNWVVGDEIWFRLFNMSSLVPSLVAGAQNQFNAYSTTDLTTSGTSASGYSMLRSYDNLTTGSEGDVAYAVNYDNNSLMFNYAIGYRDQINDTGTNINNFGTVQANINNESITRNATAPNSFAKNYITTMKDINSSFGNDFNLYTYPVSSYSSTLNNSSTINSAIAKGIFQGLVAGYIDKGLDQTTAYSTALGVWNSDNAYKNGLESYGIMDHSGNATGYGWAEMGVDYGGMIITMFTTYYQGYKVTA